MEHEQNVVSESGIRMLFSNYFRTKPETSTSPLNPEAESSLTFAHSCSCFFYPLILLSLTTHLVLVTHPAPMTVDVPTALPSRLVIGVLALQGAFIEHILYLER